MAEDGYISINRFSHQGETREIYLARRALGGSHVLQISSGSLTRLAYGDSSICQRLTLDADEQRLLVARLGWTGSLEDCLRQYFSSGETMLSDLLDICGSAGIAYRFCTIGNTLGTITRSNGSAGGREGRGEQLSLVS